MANMSDFLNSLETSAATEVSKQALLLVQQYLSRWNVRVPSTQDRLDSAIAAHQQEVRNWSEEISFKDLLKPKVTSDVFVPLDIYLLPRRQHISTNERLASAPPVNSPQERVRNASGDIRPVWRGQDHGSETSLPGNVNR